MTSADFSSFPGAEISPGKSILFRPIPAASTRPRLLPTRFDMMCCLTPLIQPLMRFLFVGTGFCSPASFRPRITPGALAAY